MKFKLASFALIAAMAFQAHAVGIGRSSPAMSRPGTTVGRSFTTPSVPKPATPSIPRQYNNTAPTPSVGSRPPNVTYIDRRNYQSGSNGSSGSGLGTAIAGAAIGSAVGSYVGTSLANPHPVTASSYAGQQSVAPVAVPPAQPMAYSAPAQYPQQQIAYQESSSGFLGFLGFLFKAIFYVALIAALWIGILYVYNRRDKIKNKVNSFVKDDDKLTGMISDVGVSIDKPTIGGLFSTATNKTTMTKLLAVVKFSVINTAFASNDKETLKLLLTPDMYIASGCDKLGAFDPKATHTYEAIGYTEIEHTTHNGVEELVIEYTAHDTDGNVDVVQEWLFVGNLTDGQWLLESIKNY